MQRRSRLRNAKLRSGWSGNDLFFWRRTLARARADTHAQVALLVDALLLQSHQSEQPALQEFYGFPTVVFPQND